MADRILTWYLEGIIGDGLEQGPIFYADEDYMPIGLRVMVKRVPDSSDLTFDIKDDGVSVLYQKARLGKGGETEEDADTFPQNLTAIEKGSLISLDVTPSGAKGITIQLELEKE